MNCWLPVSVDVISKFTDWFINQVEGVQRYGCKWWEVEGGWGGGGGGQNRIKNEFTTCHKNGNNLNLRQDIEK